MIKVLPIITIFALFISSDAYACKKAGNRPHVTAMDEGIFYAKSIPLSREGSKGITNIYLATAEEDEIVDSYNWYDQHTIVLAWSPIMGKVSVLKYSPEDEKSTISFYIGGQHLKSYSYDDLKSIDVTISKRKFCGVHLNLKIEGQEQISGTNEYVYKINFPTSGVKYFNITTGLQINEK